MQFTDFNKLDLTRLPSPCFVVDEVAVERNLAILQQVSAKSGAKILHALKAFSMFSLAPLTNKYLHGTCASGLHEALLAREFYSSNALKPEGLSQEGKGEIHVFAAGFSDSDMDELLTFANHIVFNSPSQLLRFSEKCKKAVAVRDDLDFGLRINPEHSEGAVALYDPCAAGSRLGTTRAELDLYLADEKFQEAFKLISGLHFHTLCEQDFLPLERTLNVVLTKFADLLPNLKWLNCGGGHHITAPNYQIDQLIDCLKKVSSQYNLQLYLEPGEAVAIGTGVLVAEVLDIKGLNPTQAILDTSATCHMPDTLEMPYRADINHAGELNQFAYNYRLGGLTCLAGDVIGDYSFNEPLTVGKRLIFADMAHYTMVKTSTFNGTKLPSLALWNSKTDKLTIIKNFDYQDFRNRLS